MLTTHKHNFIARRRLIGDFGVFDFGENLLTTFLIAEFSITVRVNILVLKSNKMTFVKIRHVGGTRGKSQVASNITQ